MKCFIMKQGTHVHLSDDDADDDDDDVTENMLKNGRWVGTKRTQELFV